MIFLTLLAIAVYEFQQYMKPREPYNGPEDDPFVIWTNVDPMEKPSLPLLDDILPPLPDPNAPVQNRNRGRDDEPSQAYCPPPGSYRKYYTQYDADKYKERYGEEYPKGKPYVLIDDSQDFFVPASKK